MSMLATNMFRGWAVAGLCLAHLCVASSEQVHLPLTRPNGPLITDELSKFIDQLRKTDNVPGITVGVVRQSEGSQLQIEHRAWGCRTEESSKADMTPDSLFDIASCSKAFAATSIGLLMDDFAQGRNVTSLPPGVITFDWDTKVADLLPDDWKLSDEWASKKTNLRDALSHTSGMQGHDLSYRLSDSPKEVVRRMRHLRPAFELRDHFSYNNQMYMLAAYLVSTYANMSYTAFVSSRLFDPIGMTSSTYSPNHAARIGKLTQTWSRDARRIPFWFQEENIDLNAGPGGVISNVEDLTRWLAVILKQGVDPVTNKTIFPKAVYDEVTTAHTLVSGEFTESLKMLTGTSILGYGLGWFRWSYQGHEVIWHTGSIPGFSTQIAFLPSDGLGIVVLTNAHGKATTNLAIIYRFLDIALGLAQPDRHVRKAENWTLQGVPGFARTMQHSHSEPRLRVDTKLDLEAFAGTYINPAYGAVTLCAPTSTSSHCIEVLSDFASFDASLTEGPAQATLYAVWPRVWSSHIRMQHVGGENFALNPTTLFPRGYGLNQSSFELQESDEAGFVTYVLELSGKGPKIKGFGVTIDPEGVKARERASGSNATMDTADVWFTKV